MFKVELKQQALHVLQRLRRHDAVLILDALETYLSHEPERPSRSRIKRLRGRQASTYRLRVGDHRIFYDVCETSVVVVAILHKSETPSFYGEGTLP